MSGEGTPEEVDAALGAALEARAAALYALPPHEFVAARDAAATEARAGGDPALARRLAALRRPTRVAWLLNQLVRTHPEELAEHLRPQPPMAEAWLRTDVHRRCARLVGLGHRIAGESLRQGLDRRLADELTGALRLGITDPQARAAILTGRLERHPAEVVQAGEQAGQDAERVVEEQRWRAEEQVLRDTGGDRTDGPADELAARRRARARREPPP